MGGASKSLQTLRASLRFLCVVFCPTSSTPCSARPRRERMREEWTASPLSLGWEDPAGVSRSQRPLPTSTTRGQQSVVAAARVGEGAGAGKGRLGVAGRMPVHFLIKLFLESFCDSSLTVLLPEVAKSPKGNSETLLSLAPGPEARLWRGWGLREQSLESGSVLRPLPGSPRANQEMGLAGWGERGDLTFLP